MAPSSRTFTPVLAAGDLPNDRILRRIVDGNAVCLYRLGEDVIAVQAECSHGQASLAEGYIDGGLLYCPRHHGAFDARTGVAARLPCRTALRRHAVELKDGMIFVCAEAGSPGLLVGVSLAEEAAR